MDMDMALDLTKPEFSTGVFQLVFLEKSSTLLHGYSKNTYFKFTEDFIRSQRYLNNVDGMMQTTLNNEQAHVRLAPRGSFSLVWPCLPEGAGAGEVTVGNAQLQS